jgi:hypothetical protein
MSDAFNFLDLLFLCALSRIDTMEAYKLVNFSYLLMLLFLLRISNNISICILVIKVKCLAYMRIPPKADGNTQWL